MSVEDHTNDGPKGGETGGFGQPQDGVLRRWQGFLKIAKDSYAKIKDDVERGDRLYRRKRLSKSGVAKIIENPPNHLRRRINNVIDQIYARNPKVTAKALKPVYIQIPDPITGQITQKDISEDRAQVVEEVINHELAESEFKSEIKAVLRDAKIRPEGWLQLGYQFDEDNQVDAVWFRRRSLKNMAVDPRAEIVEGVVRRCRFIAYKWSVTQEEARKMGLDVSALEANGSRQDLDSETVIYDVWHMWELAGRIQGYVTESGEREVSPPSPWPWKIDGFPFEPLRLAESIDERWSPSPILEAEGIQMEMDEMRETMNRHIVNARPVKLFDDLILDPDTVNKLAGRDKGAWKGIKGLSGMSSEVIKVFNDDALPSDFYGHYQRNDNEMISILGSSPNDQLQITGSTATESQQVAVKSANATGSQIDVFEDFLRRVIRKAKQIMIATYTTERITEIVGPDGSKYWVGWTGSALQDTDMSIEAGSTEREDSNQKQQVAINMLSAMSKIQGMDVLKLAMDVLRRSNYRNPESYKLQQMATPPAPSQPQAGQSLPGATGTATPEGGAAGIDRQMNPGV